MTPADVEAACEWWRDHAPEGWGGLVDAEPPAPTFAAGFAWDAARRQYRGPDGPVDRQALREVVEATIEIARADIGRACDDLLAGKINEVEWGLRARAIIKDVHLSAAVVGVGGKHQMTPRDYAAAGRALKAQYRYFEAFAREIGAGTTPLDGRLRARAQMYAGAAYGTLGALERAADLASGRVLAERRVLDPIADHCPECVAEAAKGWQPPGKLKAIGDCTCLTGCRCAFQRKMEPTPNADAAATGTDRPRPKAPPAPLAAKPWYRRAADWLKG